MTMARFLLHIKYGGDRPANISIARWNAMLAQASK